MGNRQISGMTGVYYVAAELSKLGYVALVTTRNSKAADIIAINDKTSATVAIEVKTCGYYTSDSFWLLGERDLQKRPENFLYVFVKLFEDKNHDFYVVPGDFVSKNVLKDEAKTGSIWYSITKKQISKYKGRWDEIERITTSV